MSIEESEIALLVLRLVAVVAVVGWLLWLVVRQLKGIRRASASGGGSLPDRPPRWDEWISLAALLVDEDDRIIECNGAAVRAFGMEREQLLQKRYPQLLLLPGSELEEGRVQSSSADGSQRLCHRGFGLRDDGRRFPAEVSVRLLRRKPVRALIEIREVEAVAPEVGGRLAQQAGVELARLALLLQEDGRGGAQLELMRALRDQASRMIAGGAQTGPRPVHFGRWLKACMDGFLATGERAFAQMHLPQSEELDFYAIIDGKQLEEVLRCVLDYAGHALGSTELTMHLSHHALAGVDSAAAGSERSLSLLFIASGGVLTNAADTALVTAEAAAAEDPRLARVRECAQSMQARITLDANDGDGWLLQLTMVARCFGVAGNAVLPSLNEPERPDAAKPVAEEPQRPMPPAPVTRAAAAKAPVARTPARRVLLVAHDADFGAWAKDLLTERGLIVDSVAPDALMGALQATADPDLVVLQAGYSFEDDFDLTFEIRQVLTAEGAPILLVTGAGRDPAKTFFDTQRRLVFPMANAVFVDAVQELLDAGKPLQRRMPGI